ncbi:MAG TPA: flagellar regulator YcgR PilZN domain-containing protein [Usitatibacter sp.]|nr:flagellar regulator YcgR PilZN domain-containing protein [Usitatibacter sp.]
MLLYRSQIDIKGLLEKLRDTSSMLWAYVDNGERLFVTHLMHVDPDCGFIVIRYSPEKHMNAALMAEASVALHASVGEAFVEFIAQGPSDTLFGETAAVRLAFPDAVLSSHRRAHPRIRVPPSVPLRCIADGSGVVSFEAHITDISQGGIGTIIYDAGISLPPGALLRGCKIVHPWGAAILADLEVLYSVTVSQTDGEPARRSGFRFAQPPAGIEELLRVFVLDLGGEGADASILWAG